MEFMLAGGLIRFVAGLMAAAPTLIVGLFVAAVLRYYLRSAGTQRLFGGKSLWSLPQSWLVGMLLPVCSIGVIPIIREMHRQGIRPGSITAFALAAPLFNPLSLLYGLTLSRPLVIVGFALGSLAVVTALGTIWDRFAAREEAVGEIDCNVIGLKRLQACLVFMTRELAGPTGALTLIALSGLFLLAAVLPHGALQSEVEQLDPLAPLKMTLVSVFVYATPMLAMSQLGMMFDHGNSPGAAFSLLLLGTGVNLATLYWIRANFGTRSTLIWGSVLLTSVLGIAYAIDRPLIPPGVEPAGHTHAFDVYTNPLHSQSSVSAAMIIQVLEKTVGPVEWIGGAVLCVLVATGLIFRVGFNGWAERLELSAANEEELSAAAAGTGLHRPVSSLTVGLTCLAGLVALSIVGCYAYYPAPSEVLEEMRLARVEVLSGASSKDYERALRWIPILDTWSRRLEVGYAIRRFELRPYQQMQTYLLRKKLELLEHAVEHASEYQDEAARGDPEAQEHLAEELEEMDELRGELSANAERIRRAFED